MPAGGIAGWGEAWAAVGDPGGVFVAGLSNAGAGYGVALEVDWREGAADAESVASGV